MVPSIGDKQFAAVAGERTTMKASLTRAVCGAGLIFALTTIFAPADAQQTEPPKFSTEELARRTLKSRAVDAVIWGMPIVSLDALRQAYFRDGKAKYGDIIWWPKGSTWKNQSLTPNMSLRYLYVFFNTKDDGPMVLDLPPGANGARGYASCSRPVPRAREASCADFGAGVWDLNPKPE
jgi:hypothetical protein